MPFELTRENAWNVLTEHTKGESLRKHALAVEAAVRGYARTFGEDEEVWGVVALLHDFDYEQYPELKDHPFRGARFCARADARVRHSRDPLARRAHEHAPESKLEHTLFACDEMAGFVTAAALVRPSKSVQDLEAAVGDEADERQGVRQGREPRRPAQGRRRAAACRSTSTSRMSSGS